ncbi:hypothetical protein [Dethiothermospora halolimnae]|uniref:hypothetical protein n=1 Tax=Dethiothermospora halolimnae TaxID=3114390 RepID=UPI003CCBE164
MIYCFPDECKREYNLKDIKKGMTNEIKVITSDSEMEILNVDSIKFRKHSDHEHEFSFVVDGKYYYRFRKKGIIEIKESLMTIYIVDNEKMEKKYEDSLKSVKKQYLITKIMEELPKRFTKEDLKRKTINQLEQIMQKVESFN